MSSTPEAKTPNISSTPAPSCAPVAGTMNIPRALEVRKEPLTESQLMQIASKLLLKPPRVLLSKKTKLGTKTVTDETGTYEVEGCDVGEEDDLTLEIYLRDGLVRELFEAALRPSPPSAVLYHLQRLAMHKRLGSDERDRTVLLHDYAEALRCYSDFVVFCACRMFWETNEEPFYPKIKPLRELCELLHQFFTKCLNAPNLPTQIEAQSSAKVSRYSDPFPHPVRRQICDFLIAKGEPDYFADRHKSNYDLEEVAYKKYNWYLKQ